LAARVSPSTIGHQIVTKGKKPPKILSIEVVGIPTELKCSWNLCYWVLHIWLEYLCGFGIGHSTMWVRLRGTPKVLLGKMLPKKILNVAQKHKTK
jgi:hypothetical protein